MEEYLLEPYGEGAVIFKNLPLEKNDQFRNLGCDYPLKDDVEWRFWIEHEDINDNNNDTVSADLSFEEMEKIKQLIRSNKDKFFDFFES